ncbi:hypothetical protein ACN9JF_08060 [Pseudoalteromonas lipolytica]|uniref:hypothetical protein n=1 Tax=Pseudoalteromonas lipolytica TaxID=570156 RepID=UPI003B9F4FEC
MDRLELKWELEDCKKGKNVVRRLCVIINGVPLNKIMLSFEEQQSFTHFGDVFLNQKDVKEYSQDAWLQSIQSGKCHILLLGCDCGHVECSFFYADVYNQDGWVYWKFGGFPERDYSEFPFYWFDLRDYQKSIDMIFKSENKY